MVLGIYSRFGGCIFSYRFSFWGSGLARRVRAGVKPD